MMFQVSMCAPTDGSRWQSSQQLELASSHRRMKEQVGYITLSAYPILESPCYQVNAAAPSQLSYGTTKPNHLKQYISRQLRRQRQKGPSHHVSYFFLLLLRRSVPALAAFGFGGALEGFDVVRGVEAAVDPAAVLSSRRESSSASASVPTTSSCWASSPRVAALFRLEAPAAFVSAAVLGCGVATELRVVRVLALKPL